MTELPVFATNRLVPPMTVGAEVNKLFKINREALTQPPQAAIATAYVNPAGFMLIADELERLPRLRLLLGAEPLPEPHLQLDANASNKASLKSVLDSHDAWLRAERDSLGFERHQTESARRLVAWLRAADERGEPVVDIRRYTGGFLHGKAYISNHPSHPAYLAGSSNLTLAGLTRNAELNVGAAGNHGSIAQVIDWYEECWETSEPYDLAGLYEPLWAEHSPWSIFLRMLWERYGAHLDEERAGPTRFELTRFQADGVKRMQRLIDEVGGVLVADEVGLGKTFLALEVIATVTEQARQRVMVAAPAALKSSVWDPLLERYDLSRRVTVHSYEEIRSRMDPEHPNHQEFSDRAEDAALIIVDEAHNLRNAGAARSVALDRIILSGRYPKKVVLLTATPVNNSLIDLDTLIRYFIRDDARFAAQGIPSIRDYIRAAQRLDPDALTPNHLFDLMDQVAVRRTRRFVKDNYRGETVPGPGGRPIPVEFPDAVVRRIDYDLDEPGTALVDAVTYALDIPEDEAHAASFDVRRGDPGRLLLSRYAPSAYLTSEELNATQVSNMGLLRSALLKRLESSPYALAGTLSVLIKTHEAFLAALNGGWVLTGGALRDFVNAESEELDEMVATLDEDLAHQAVPASSYHADVLRDDVALDLELLYRLHDLAQAAGHASEPKAGTLIDQLAGIAQRARTISPQGISHADRRKVVVFSTYADTIRDLHQRLSSALMHLDAASPLADYRGRLAPPVIGEYASGKSGGINQESRARAIAQFAPRTAGRLDDDGNPRVEDAFDILLTTDVLAEGVNLQQAAQVINYDLPWNPMRIVQRHGRVDRIGSQHPEIHLGVFFPAEHLDEFLKLELTLIRKLKQADAAVGTGTVLPGVAAFPPRDHYDADDITRDIEELVNQGGGSAAGSGEEYRRRLFKAIEADRDLRRHLELLAHGIGSGFENPSVEGNLFVFCMRMGGSDKVWFRNVPVNTEWDLTFDEDGAPVVLDNSLASLVSADPGGPATPRVLTEQGFSAAYDAWAEARANAHREWVAGTDPNALAGKPPASFRDATRVVMEGAAHLTVEKSRTLVRRLSSIPSNKASRAMRTALTAAGDTKKQLGAIESVLDEFGVQPAEAVQPLPPLDIDDIRLVAWMAVTGTKVPTTGPQGAAT